MLLTGGRKHIFSQALRYKGRGRSRCTSSMSRTGRTQNYYWKLMALFTFELEQKTLEVT